MGVRLGAAKSVEHLIQIRNQRTYGGFFTRRIRFYDQ